MIWGKEMSIIFVFGGVVHGIKKTLDANSRLVNILPLLSNSVTFACSLNSCMAAASQVAWQHVLMLSLGKEKRYAAINTGNKLHCKW